MNEIAPTKAKHHWRAWIFIIVMLIVLLLLFIFGALPRWQISQENQAIADAHPLPRVPVMRIQANNQPIDFILPSSSQAWHVTPIWARTNGYLKEWYVDIGDVVKEGDLLCLIDTPEVDQELEQSIADLLNSLALMEIAKITADRWQMLWDKNPQAVTRQEVDQYNANYKATQATVLSNQKNVARLRSIQEFKYIYAPFNGIIIQRSIDIGSLIYGTVNEVPQELYQIAKSDILRFYVQVPQNFVRQIKNGVAAEVNIREFPQKLFKGTVARYAKALDPTARTLLTEVDIPNPQGILYPGLFSRVKFMMYPDYLNFVVPTTALIIRNSFPNIAVLDNNNVIHMRQIQIDRDYGKAMVISGGDLKVGDRIITIPNDNTTEGAKVQVIQTTQGPTGPPRDNFAPPA